RPAPRASGTAAPAPSGAPAAATEAQPLTGARARIAKNMEASLEIPTATSVRTVAVKLLEENRRVINQHQGARAGSKVSFTHLVGWAIVRALEKHPEMNAAYESIGGAPHLVKRGGVNFGVAIDTQKKGERVLLVPCIKRADALDFPGFLAAYDALVS